MNLILPIFLIVSSIAIFFGYVDPNYKGVGQGYDGLSASTTIDYSDYGVLFLRKELEEYKKISNDSKEIVKNRQILMDKNNQINTSDKTRLTKMLPDNIDNLRLIIEISDMATARGLVAKNISISDEKKNTDSINTSYSAYGTLVVKFSVNSTYENFKLFLGDLEDNLRLFDVTDISFSATDVGFYDFNISLKTYWLK